MEKHSAGKNRVARCTAFRQIGILLKRCHGVISFLFFSNVCGLELSIAHVHLSRLDDIHMHNDGILYVYMNMLN